MKKLMSILTILFLLVWITGCVHVDDNTTAPAPAPDSVNITTESSLFIPTTTPTKPPETPDFSTPTSQTTVPTPTEDDSWDDAYVEDTEPVYVPPTETNISVINFTSYSDADGDFTVDYPPSWSTSSVTNMSLDNRVTGVDRFKRDERIVTIKSDDETVIFTAITEDFIVPGTPVPIPYPLIEWCRDSVTRTYPDVNGATAVTNYEKKIDHDTKKEYLSFDVIFLPGSQEYPREYSQMNTFSYHRFYTFQFETTMGNLTTYRDLKDRMFSSIVTEDLIPESA